MKRFVFVIILLLGVNWVNAQEELFDREYVKFLDSLSFKSWQTKQGKWNQADCQPLTSDVSDKRWQYNVYSSVKSNGFSDRYTYYFDKGNVYRIVLSSLNGDKSEWLDENLQFIEEKSKEGNTYRYYDAVSFKVVMVEVKGNYYYWCEL